MTASEKFVENVYAVCKHRGIFIWELEREIKISHGYFSRLKRNPKNVTLSVVKATADYLKLKVEDLVESDMATKAKIEELKRMIEVEESCLKNLREELAALEQPYDACPDVTDAVKAFNRGFARK